MGLLLRQTVLHGAARFTVFYVNIANPDGDAGHTPHRAGRRGAGVHVRASGRRSAVQPPSDCIVSSKILRRCRPGRGSGLMCGRLVHSMGPDRPIIGAGESGRPGPTETPQVSCPPHSSAPLWPGPLLIPKMTFPGLRRWGHLGPAAPALSLHACTTAFLLQACVSGGRGGLGCVSGFRARN